MIYLPPMARGRSVRSTRSDVPRLACRSSPCMQPRTCCVALVPLDACYCCVCWSRRCVLVRLLLLRSCARASMSLLCVALLLRRGLLFSSLSLLCCLSTHCTCTPCVSSLSMIQSDRFQKYAVVVKKLKSELVTSQIAYRYSRVCDEMSCLEQTAARCLGHIAMTKHPSGSIVAHTTQQFSGAIAHSDILEEKATRRARESTWFEPHLTIV